VAVERTCVREMGCEAGKWIVPALAGRVTDHSVLVPDIYLAVFLRHVMRLELAEDRV